MFQHDPALEEALQFSRFDVDHPLSTHSPYGFELEEASWPTAEHYYQASKFVDTDYGRKIARCETPQQANKMGNAWLKRKRADFKKVRVVLMTRALYSKAIQNDRVKQYLLDTGDKKIIEISQFDHFWGVARDLRGENQLGKIWMDIRSKLRQAESAVGQDRNTPAE